MMDSELRDRVVFMTGVTGFLGEELLGLLAARPVRRIYCLVRPSRTSTSADRLADVLTELGVTDRSCIEAIEGDVRLDGLGMPPGVLERLASQVTHVIHGAAEVRFNEPLNRIRATNVDGVRHVMEFARACRRRSPHFSHVDYVSTAFVAGRQTGVVAERDATGRYGFRNTYEQSKFEAEQLVEEYARDIPTIVYRPTIVVGAAETGKARPHNVIYPLLRLFSKWRWPIVPINKQVRVDAVPVDFVARAILALSGDPKNVGAHYHLAAGPEGDIALTRLLELVGATFGRRVLVMPIPIWKYLIRPCLRTFRRRFSEEARPVVAAFESYLWEVGPRYDMSRTRVALEGTGVTLPNTERFLVACLSFARDSAFGAAPPSLEA
jgi:thioester reductase-like protein